MSDRRIEIDSMGEVEVPADALYQAQTQRAINNFSIAGKPMPLAFIRHLLLIKQAAANANKALSVLDDAKANAIALAVQRLLYDENLSQHFPVDVLQTGSGTSSNMNANEVLATVASQNSGLHIHPNDDVNCSQSSNDVIPTCIQVTSCMLTEQQLIPALHTAIAAIEERARELVTVTKTGRTHLMDAMPITFGQVLTTWSSQLKQSLQGIERATESLRVLPQGGTAVGTGVNCPAHFGETFCQQLSALTQSSWSSSPHPFTGIGAQDHHQAFASAVKVLATSLYKIANDLRWMNSGPLTGMAEIRLPALQPGSSIMPGKVNPVVPEAICMACVQVTGLETAITLAAQSSNFELNVMLPIIADNLVTMIGLMERSLMALTTHCLSFEVNQHHIEAHLSKNPILVTALNNLIGYQRAAEIAKQAYQQKRSILEVAEQMTDIDKDELARLLNPLSLTGKHTPVNER